MHDLLPEVFLTLLVGLTAYILLKCSLALARRKWPGRLQSTALDWLLVILSVLAGSMAT
jgi:hypothetical protein